MFALPAFTLAVVIVEEVLVVVFVVSVDGHADQSDQRIDVEGSFLLAGGVFRATDRASAEDRRGKTTQQQTANVHVRPFGSRDSDLNSAGSLSRAAKRKRFPDFPATCLILLIHRRFPTANSFQVASMPTLPL